MSLRWPEKKQHPSPTADIVIPSGREEFFPGSFTLRPKELSMKSHNRKRQASILARVVMLALLFQCGIVLAQSAEEGLGNFYSDSFQGRKMSNGEPYDKNKLTASHKKHPFGTKLKVTNLDSSRSVVVTVTDRMGQKNPAVIDVTRRAAEELGFAKAGKARVKLELEQ
jgi:peptidoglycan lytic transglycosylase